MADKQTDSMPQRAPAEPGAFEEQIDQEPPNVGEAQQPSPDPDEGDEDDGRRRRGGNEEGDAEGGRGGDAGAASAGNDGDVEAEARQIEQDMESVQRQFSTLSDRHLRLAAEFDNYRKRVERERADAWSRAQAELAGRLLDVLDDLERVSAHGDGSSADALLEGVRLVERKLRQALAAAGLEPIEAEGADFDPNTMEAVAMVEAESHDDDDVVSDVFQRGYTFKGALLRPARVRVRKYGA
jgi:molecular chaperone GrpE